MAKSSVTRPLVAAGVMGLLGVYLFSNSGYPRPGSAAAATTVAPATATPTAAALAETPAALADAQKVIFNRDIRPLLSDRCFPCHGFDNNKRQSGLRLDTREGAFDPLPKHKDKRAFVPGKPEASFAYQRMISTDPKEVMPPATSHLKLNDADKDLVRRWIEQGAKWQDHWAFVKPERPPVPAVKDTKWPRNDIDRFVLARMEAEGLKPSPEADKDTLIRRVTLDLTGLPPTLEEVDAFVKDDSPNAYEKVVDRLLASPHYGEQMAAHWLDEARYADSHGFQSDPERHMWHWRDWVINAFNKGMPYDRFATEQLAGDLLPNATEDQKIATGFNRNHRMNSEGGIIDEEWRVETVIDRCETTSETFLGLTMGCCRCHDHKFDPITQKEFYSFSAYFNSINERGEYFSAGLDKGINGAPVMKCLAPADKAKVAAYRAAAAAADNTLVALQSHLPEYEQRYKAEQLTTPEPDGLALRFALDGSVDAVVDPRATTRPAVATTAAAKATTRATKAAARRAAAGVVAAKVVAKFEPKDDTKYVDAKIGKGIHFDGKGTAAVNAGQAINFERTDAFSFGAWVNLQSGDGSILSKMDPGDAFTGIDLFLEGGKVAPHFVNKWPQDALKVITAKPLPMNQWVHVFVTYDGSSKPSGVTVYVDGIPQATTVDKDSLRRSIKCKSPLLIGKRIASSPLNGTVDDVRFYSRVLSREEVARLAVGPDLRALIAVEPAKRKPEQKAKLAAALLAADPQYTAAVADRDKANAAADAIENDPANTTMVMEDLKKPRDTFVLVRGQYDKHGEKVDVGVPAVLNPLPKGAPKNRLGLAMWITSPDNPLTARVRVNRLWEKFFGVGIVKTSENFGTQADWPSHPELLDWLATEFEGPLKWDMKAIQREIVTSATYRQASTISPDLLERDPENRLLARGPRFRLSAEQVRDQALAVAGLLSDKIGGRSVKPYGPSNLWDGNLYGNLKEYVQDKGDDLYRRSLYTFIKRTAAPPNLMVFDLPSREYCVVKRSRTNTPLQALDVLNDPTYVEAARMLAERMMTAGGSTPADRLAYAFRRTTCRPPTGAEAKILEDQLTAQLDHYRKAPADAEKLLAIGATPRDPKLAQPELAAYTMAASVILNLDETINKP